MFYDRFELLKTTNDICSWYILLKYREEEFPIRGKEFRQAFSKILLIFLYFQWPRTVKAYQTVNITLHSSTVCNITERKGNRYSSMTQKAYPHRIMSIDQQKISQNHEIVFLHYLVKFLIWRPFSPINKLPINTQVKATVATNQNSSFNNPRTVTARWLHMHASMGPVLKSYKLTTVFLILTMALSSTF